MAELKAQRSSEARLKVTPSAAECTSKRLETLLQRLKSMNAKRPRSDRLAEHVARLWKRKMAEIKEGSRAVVGKQTGDVPISDRWNKTLTIGPGSATLVDPDSSSTSSTVSLF